LGGGKIKQIHRYIALRKRKESLLFLFFSWKGKKHLRSPLTYLPYKKKYDDSQTKEKKNLPSLRISSEKRRQLRGVRGRTQRLGDPQGGGNKLITPSPKRERRGRVGCTFSRAGQTGYS